MHTLTMPPGIATKIFIMSRGAVADVPQLLAERFPGRKPFVVADENTLRAGAKLAGVLPECRTPYLFPAVPVLHGSEEIARKLAAALPENCVPVALGSGSINDIVKRASGLRELPYCCVPTAASVDGYTSSGAALTERGMKRTMPCPPPTAVAADIDILESAPGEMMASGYADLAAKLTGGADWLIADALGIEAVDPASWDLVQRDLRDYLAHPEDLQGLFLGLANSGYAMQLYRDSRPASGAEHLFSHIWEMENLCVGGEPVSHGFKVGVGTLAATLLMEYIIATPVAQAVKIASSPTPGQREKEIDALTVRNCYGDGVRETALEKFSGHAGRKTAIFANWCEIQSRLKAQLVEFDTLEVMLKKAGCPVRPAAIGLSREQFLHGIAAAQLIRKRYTVIDLLYDCGLLQSAMVNLERMF